MVLIDYSKQRAHIANTHSSAGSSSRIGAKSLKGYRQQSEPSIMASFEEAQHGSRRETELPSISFCVRQTSFKIRRQDRADPNVSSRERLHQSLQNQSLHGDLLNDNAFEKDDVQNTPPPAYDRRRVFAESKPRPSFHQRKICLSPGAKEDMMSSVSSLQLSESFEDKPKPAPSLAPRKSASMRDILLPQTSQGSHGGMLVKNTRSPSICSILSQSDDDSILDDSKVATNDRPRLTHRPGSLRNLFVDTSLPLAASSANSASKSHPPATRRESRQSLLIDLSGVDASTVSNRRRASMVCRGSSRRNLLAETSRPRSSRNLILDNDQPADTTDKRCMTRRRSSRNITALQNKSSLSADDSISYASGGIRKNMMRRPSVVRRSSQRSLLAFGGVVGGDDDVEYDDEQKQCPSSVANDACLFVTGSRIRRHGSGSDLQAFLRNGPHAA